MNFPIVLLLATLYASTARHIGTLANPNSNQVVPTKIYQPPQTRNAFPRQVPRQPVQATYPPSQSTYPPSQATYPPSQATYPPSQATYTPNQATYPLTQLMQRQANNNPYSSYYGFNQPQLPLQHSSAFPSPAPFNYPNMAPIAPIAPYDRQGTDSAGQPGQRQFSFNYQQPGIEQNQGMGLPDMNMMARNLQFGQSQTPFGQPNAPYGLGLPTMNNGMGQMGMSNPNAQMPTGYPMGQMPMNLIGNPMGQMPMNSMGNPMGQMNMWPGMNQMNPAFNPYMGFNGMMPRMPSYGGYSPYGSFYPQQQPHPYYQSSNGSGSDSSNMKKSERSRPTGSDMNASPESESTMKGSGSDIIGNVKCICEPETVK